MKDINGLKCIIFPEQSKKDNPEDEVNDFLQKIKDNYLNQPDTECIKVMLNKEIQEFKQYMKYEYPDYDLTFDLQGDLAYYDDTWTVEDICKAHKLYFKDRHVEKEEYTRIEVNNMLFDLKELSDVLNYYSPVALCTVDGSSYNEEIFDGVVDVECRYYWEENAKSDLEILEEKVKEKIKRGDLKLEMTLPEEVLKELEPK